jgi:FkbM family methyltransferase
MELKPADFQNCLDDLMPRVGKYGWMWTVLRVRARKIGRFPFKLYSVLQRFGNANKPYFVEKTGGGITFMGDYRDIYAVSCAVCPDYDDPLLGFMEQRVKHLEGDYLDVGTNLGVVAATMARSLQDRGEVIAFEPIPETAKRAAATFALNSLKNVRLFRCAISDEDGEITFFNAPGRSEAASANRTEQSIDWIETKVPCRTLDSLVEQKAINKVGLMKIDVEGHEPKAVRGAGQLIARQKPEIIYEYHRGVAPKVGWEAADVAALINKASRYRFRTLNGDSTLSNFPPPPDSGEVVNIYGKSCPDVK